MKEYRKKGHSVAQILSDVDQSMQVISMLKLRLLARRASEHPRTPLNEKLDMPLNAQNFDAHANVQRALPPKLLM